MNEIKTRRQLLDDDQQQVTALKEMLLEDGDLHSDFNRKRKFQWDEVGKFIHFSLFYLDNISIFYVDENDAAFKKPLFSDNEDDNENDDALSDDEKAEQWRKERFKRESYLSQVFTHYFYQKTIKNKSVLLKY